jgi:hypothetical protein
MAMFTTISVLLDNTTVWQSIRRVLGLERGSQASTPALHPEPPEPPEFGHPGNRPIFDYFRQDSSWNGTTQEYGTRTHPDLAEILFELVADPAVRTGYAYGRPVVANRHGLIFAWAGGTHDFFARLNADEIATACGEGARHDPTYPPEWVDFHMLRLGRDWKAILRRWVTKSYEETLSSE